MSEWADGLRDEGCVWMGMDGYGPGYGYGYGYGVRIRLWDTDTDTDMNTRAPLLVSGELL